MEPDLIADLTAITQDFSEAVDRAASAFRTFTTAFPPTPFDEQIDGSDHEFLSEIGIDGVSSPRSSA